MRRILATIILGIASLLLVACGEAATPEPTAVPPTEPPAAAPTEVPTAAPTEAEEEPEAMEGDYSPELLAVAAERANGPGAIFVGDLDDLVGPAPTPDEGDAEGIVPISALENHR